MRLADLVLNLAYDFAQLALEIILHFTLSRILGLDTGFGLGRARHVAVNDADFAFDRSLELVGHALDFAILALNHITRFLLARHVWLLLVPRHFRRL
ncbi:hypothetical protein FHL15_005896 [Xylaria flabelliformis]|uniref:Uncharacterized protein n=1 Tax=Xylaria flabelliformis TaxID=2512241 RepID=A0A553HZD2_9PEZI|nr:hypothetical protein FHL15_005896 [Xylaria flabelliformis]